ncbi:MAG: glycosyltransferase family 4 protein [Anaerolineae bacterium]|jgi:glycosyltransferase involved in cell wall biosynthesis|nr:glycosyltransferase family 4 protein [Anaerolineae bacterium]
MKILFITELASIHAARWINQFQDQNWDIHVFQGLPRSIGVCPEFRVGKFYIPSISPIPNNLPYQLTITNNFLTQIAGRIIRKFNLRGRFPNNNLLKKLSGEFALAYSLADVIQTIKPDIIHSLGLNINWENMMISVSRARQILGGFNVPWVYSSWGADLMHFPNISTLHRKGVEEVLSLCDYHISECERDANLAREFGFDGEMLGFLPAFGGVTWDAAQYKIHAHPSQRRTILIKGRDITGGDPQGRALSIMSALALCKEDLLNYRIVICHAAPSVSYEAAILGAVSGLDIQIIPHLDYHSWLRIMGGSRLLIAATVTDGLPGTLVEAMSLGALPVHSGVDSVQEWIQDGVNGLLIPPEDPDKIAQAIRRAVKDDDLVDKAAEINEKIVNEKLSDTYVKPKAVEMYRHAVRRGKKYQQ